MAGVLLPISTTIQYLDNNVQKLAGGTINSYTAGTTTPINTYTDSTLGTSNGTALTLDANGRPTQEMWVAAGTTVKIIVKDSSGNQIGPTLDNISGLNDLGTTQNLGPFWGGSAGGSANALTLTFSSGPSAYQAGQRVTFLATATNSTAATVNVNGLGSKAIQNNTAALVGGEIINGNLYELEYTGTAFQVVAMPADPVTIKGAQTITGQKTMSGAAFVFANEALNVASAATVNLDAVASNYAQITGTTTITAITLANGSRKDVVFSGSLTLTNGASLILPGGANIQTTNGDTATFVGEASGVVRCLSYVFAGSSGVGARSLTRTASTSGTSIDFTIPSFARRVTVNFEGVSTNGTSNIIIQLGTGGTPQTTNYLGTSYTINSASITAALMSGAQNGFPISVAASAAGTINGLAIFTLSDATNGVWTTFGSGGRTDTANVFGFAGSKSVGGVLNIVRITTNGGTDAFDAGAISCFVE